MGRVAAIKMSILPKLLYYFRALSVYVSHRTIEQIPRDINSFIWKNMKPRYGKLITHRPLHQEGLGLPNIWHYYVVARLAQTAQWHISNAQLPWLQFEMSPIRPFYLPGPLWHTKVWPRETGSLNSITSQAFHLRSLYHHNFKLCSPSHPPFLIFGW